MSLIPTELLHLSTPYLVDAYIQYVSHGNSYARHLLLTNFSGMAHIASRAAQAAGLLN